MMSSSSNNQQRRAQPKHGSRVRLSKRLQEYLLDLLERKNTEDHVPGSEEPTPHSSTHLGKRHTHDSPDQEFPLPSAKRARLSNPAATAAAATTAPAPAHLHEPAPLRPSGNDRYARFLQSFVDNDPPDAVFRPDWVSPFVYRWIASPDQPTRPRSDSFLYLGDDEPTPPARSTSPVGRRANSAPAMARRYDADGFAIPPVPESSGSSASRRLGDNSAYYSGAAPSFGRTPSPRRSVDEIRYRRDLEDNGICLLPPRSTVPEHVMDLVGQIRRRRDSPGPTLEEIETDSWLYRLEMGATEAEVQDYFERTAFPKAAPSGPLAQAIRQPMLRHAVPSAQTTRAISTPEPDLMYGYNISAFSSTQWMQLDAMPTSAAVTSTEMYFPFFLVEYKGQDGNMRVATNQCLGGAASCVHVAERLNDQLRQCASADPGRTTGVKQVDNAVFSVALNGTEARLYVSWRHDDLAYHTIKVRSFAVQEPDQYLEFRQYARNIVDWGRDVRFREIGAALDMLQEESRRAATATAKSRSPPHAATPPSSSSAGSSSGRDKRHQATGAPATTSGSGYEFVAAPFPASGGADDAAASGYDAGGGYGIDPTRGRESRRPRPP